MVDYSSRLKIAMNRSGASVSALASAIGISYQAVKKLVDGGSRSFSAENNQKAAKFLGISSEWLATGSGVMAQDQTDSRSDIEAAFETLAMAVKNLEEMTCAQLEPVLLQLLKTPNRALELAQRFESTINLCGAVENGAGSQKRAA